MDPFVLGILSIVLMIALTFLGIPIALALLAIGALGNTYLMGLPQTAMQIHMITWETGTNFLLIAVPLFIFMGQLVYHTEIASDLYDFVHKWFGRFRGRHRLQRCGHRYHGHYGHAPNEKIQIQPASCHRQLGICRHTGNYDSPQHTHGYLRRLDRNFHR